PLRLNYGGVALWARLGQSSVPAAMDTTDVLGDYHEHIDDDAFLCCPVPHNSSVAGVIMKNRLDRLHNLSVKNLHLSIVCMMYIGVNVVCITLNSMSEEGREANELVFHLLEFWATFVFSVVQVYSLTFSPRSLGAVYSNPLVLKLVVFFNVVATFISALLVTVSLESFEAPSHELEYFNEITMAFVDVVLFAVVVRQAGNCSTLLTTLVALVVAVVQLLIYNLLDGPGGGFGEQLAHFFEFAFEISSAFISAAHQRSCATGRSSCCCGSSRGPPCAPRRPPGGRPRAPEPRRERRHAVGMDGSLPRTGAGAVP
ncbi:unnamed protein product, partial [Prorocentrum cordatum]